MVAPRTTYVRYCPQRVLWPWLELLNRQHCATVVEQVLKPNLTGNRDIRSHATPSVPPAHFAVNDNPKPTSVKPTGTFLTDRVFNFLTTPFLPGERGKNVTNAANNTRCVPRNTRPIEFLFFPACTLTCPCNSFQHDFLKLSKAESCVGFWQNCRRFSFGTSRTK